MRIVNGIVAALIVAISGCIEVSDGDVEMPLSADDNHSVSTKDPSSRPIWISPRIKWWLNTTKFDFHKDGEDNAVVYRLTLESPEAMTEYQRSFIQEYFRCRAADSFAAANALQSTQVVVVVLSEKTGPTTYYGEATACGNCDVSLSYDSGVRKGTLSMKIRNGNLIGTRELIKQNIEAIVRDKNIRLVGGVNPPPGRYYVLNEIVKDGNVLEVEFEAE